MPNFVSTAWNRGLHGVGTVLAAGLNHPISNYRAFTHSDFATLCEILRPGDVLLVEGNAYVSQIIKYLTQSTWSHAALYVGDVLPAPTDGSERPRLVEDNLGEGCIAAPLSKYAHFNTRICRPVGLSEADRAAVVANITGRIGTGYDLRNIFDLLRYFLPLPIPARWRRRALAVGSGDPTRAICSTLIASAFQSIQYPILPDISISPANRGHARHEIYHIRNHALFAPRDFDLSPYFKVVKPRLTEGFDFRAVEWDPPAGPA